MDPRLKAYQKQSRSPVSGTPPTADPDDPLPVVRAARLPQFDPPLVKTVAPDPPKTAAEPPRSVPGGLAGDKSLRKVAKFLILLGQDEAAKVVRHLEPSQIEALGREIAGIKKIEPVEAEAILQEFGYMATTQAQTVRGGKGTAQAILDQAFGGEKAKTILKKAVPPGGEKPFAFFADLEPEVVTALLGAESSQVLSVVVPFLEKAQAAAFLRKLPAEARLELVKRLAKMEKVPQSVVAQVDQSLKERLHALSPAQSDAVDGKARLADILRHLPAGQEEAILQAVGAARPDLGDALRRRLFTAADLLRVDDGGFEVLLRDIDDRRLGLLWLAADPPLRTKIEGNISARRLLLVRAEVDLQADTPAREQKKELRYFVDEVREAIRQGRAALLDGAEEYL